SSGDVLGTLSFPDHLTSIAFAGVTAANTVIGAQGDSAFSRFVTATVYNDFSDERESIVTLGGGSGNAISQFTENLGTFGEVSLGLSYIKILDGQVGSAKQLNASVRLDTRFSNQVDATSITAQVRLQF
ncbi:MAG: fibronectin-binding autotransporter adhesin, partial [Paracoccaceae bacterium]